jgi:hypothetical protein
LFQMRLPLGGQAWITGGGHLSPVTAALCNIGVVKCGMHVQLLDFAAYIFQFPTFSESYPSQTVGMNHNAYKRNRGASAFLVPVILMI